METKQVTVLGSINMDLGVKVAYLPKQGETLTGHSFSVTGGGKGANQAIAIARLGMETALIARLGNDDFGKQLQRSLRENKVNIDGIQIDEQESTGVALVTVEENGENNIIIVAGANGTIGDWELTHLEKVLPHSSYLLLQLEIPRSVVIKAVKLAQKYNVPVILDPAPALDLPEEIYGGITIITPNVIEASQLLEFPINNIEDVQKASSLLLNKGVKIVIITMGEQGVFCATNKEQFRVYAPSAQVLDTVGAGDAFNGGLTTALSEGYSLTQAVQWGVIASYLSISKAGAQSSFAHRSEFEQARQQSSLQVNYL